MKKNNYFNNQVDLVVVHGDNNDNENDSDNDHSMTTTITHDDDDKKIIKQLCLYLTKGLWMAVFDSSYAFDWSLVIYLWLFTLVWAQRQSDLSKNLLPEVILAFCTHAVFKNNNSLPKIPVFILQTKVFQWKMSHSWKSYKFTSRSWLEQTFYQSYQMPVEK